MAAPKRNLVDIYTQPIPRLETRTPQEVFSMMTDRIRWMLRDGGPAALAERDARANDILADMADGGCGCACCNQFSAQALQILQGDG